MQLATDLDGVLLPFTHQGKEGSLQVEFKYYAKKDIRDENDSMDINDGATYVVWDKS